MIKEQNRSDLRYFFLESVFKSKNWGCESITSDASFRAYFRVSCEQQTYVLMDSLPTQVDNAPFIQLNTLFQRSEFKLPAIINVDEENGFLLLSDLGNQHLADKLHEPERVNYYESILQKLPSIAALPYCDAMKPYSCDFIKNELNIFTEWLLQKWLGIELSDDFLQKWQVLSDRLTANMLAQPSVTMHRDFHSRNIMFDKEHWALIDYQDAVKGPLTYDSASLLRDCYYRLSEKEFAYLRKLNFDILKEKGVITDLTYNQYCLYFDLTGMQRHFKAAGIFTRLHIRDGKSGYLHNIVPTIQYIIDVALQYSEFNWLVPWLKNDLTPMIESKLRRKK